MLSSKQCLVSVLLMAYSLLAGSPIGKANPICHMWVEPEVPATIPQGKCTSGTVYFDVTSPVPGAEYVVEISVGPTPPPPGVTQTPGEIKLLGHDEGNCYRYRACVNPYYPGPQSVPISLYGNALSANGGSLTITAKIINGPVDNLPTCSGGFCINPNPQGSAVVRVVPSDSITFTNAPLSYCRRVSAELQPACHPTLTSVAWSVETPDGKTPKWLKIDPPDSTSRTEIVLLPTDEEITATYVNIIAVGEAADGCTYRKVAALGIDLDGDGDCNNGCSGCSEGIGAGCVTNSSIDVKLDLGHASDGGSAGSLIMYERTPRDDLISIDSFTVTPHADIIIADTDPTGYRERQIKVPDGLVILSQDLTVPTAMEIGFYSNSAAGTPSGGVYTPTGSAFRTWTFEDPTGDVVLKITDDGTPGGIYEFSYSDEVPIGWTLVERDSSNALVRTIKRTDDGEEDRTETYEVLDASSATIKKLVRSYELVGEDEVLQSKAEYAAGSTALATTYDDLSSLVRRVQYPDGSWVIRERDVDDRTLLEVRPWGDMSPPSSADEDDGHSFEYEYDSHTMADDESVEPFSARTITERIEGTIVAQTYYAYYRESGTNEKVIIEEQEDDLTSSPGYGTSNLRTTTRYYAPEEEDEEVKAARDELKSIISPDGTMLAYEYELGVYTPGMSSSVPGTFTPDAEQDEPTGTDLRTTVKRGYWTGSAFAEVEAKSTHDISIRDAQGRTILNETYVVTSSSPARIAWTVMEYDERHRLVGRYTSTNDNRTYSYAQFECCGEVTETGPDGAVVTTKVEPGVRTTTQVGYGSIGDLITIETLDEFGRVIQRTVTDGDSESPTSLTTYQAYDWSGRLTSTTDEAGLITTYAYSTSGSGGEIVTTTYPGPTGQEPTEVRESYRDDQLKSLTGTRPIHQHYEYDLDGNDLRTTTVYTGPHTSMDPSERFVITSVDALGRTVVEQRPGWGGAITSTHYYNSQGQRLKTSTTGAADRLYEYDELGHQIASGLDLSTPNGQLDYDGVDRIESSDTVYRNDLGDGQWWRESTSQIYATDNDDAATVVQVSRSKLTGLASDELSVSQAVDVSGNTTTTSIEVNPTAHTRSTITAYPDGTSRTDTVTAGVLTASISKAGLTTTFGYDVLRRRISVKQHRHAYPSMVHYDAYGRIDYREDAAGNRTSFGFDPDSGTIITVTNPDSKVRYQSYDAHGNLTRIWGQTDYPVEYAYDDFGQRTAMTTWRDSGINWNTSTWPTGASEDSTTTWAYDDATGLLESKTYEDSTAVSYAYTVDGKLDTRTWARASGTVTTEYVYDSGTGNLLQVNHAGDDDLTPDVTFTYDRLGRKLTAESYFEAWDDSTVTYTYTYRADNLQVDTETVAFDMYGTFTKVITRDYEGTGSGLVPGRLSDLQVGTALYPTADYAIAYAYDSAGRLNKITGTGLPGGGVIYEPLKSGASVVGDMVANTIYKDGSNDPLLTATRTFEANRDLVTSVANSDTVDLWSSYTYDHDQLGRRTSVAYGGDAFDMPNLYQWTNNERGELELAERFEGWEPEEPGDHYTTNGAFKYAYAYDDIGNRDTFAVDEEDPIEYDVNSVNQYTLTDDGTSTESFTYDADGNLIQDGRYKYTWDAENRLIIIQTRPDLGTNTGGPDAGDKLLEFAYDYMGRRIAKWHAVHNGSYWDYSGHTDQRYLYDDWNVVLVTGHDATIETKYAWGLDLSGQAGDMSASGIHGAGGIGGVLSAVHTSGTAAGTYWYTFDANGNTSELFKYTTGPEAVARQAHYEYDPYGNITFSFTAYAIATKNPFRFSTKWLDGELAGVGVNGAVGIDGLYYYGYRYYSPRLGRWGSRDPMAEWLQFPAATSWAGMRFSLPDVEQDLYRALGNAAIDSWDFIGLVCGCKSCRAWTNSVVVGHTWIECDDGTVIDFRPSWLNKKNITNGNWATTCVDLEFHGLDYIPLPDDFVGPPVPKCTMCQSFKDCMKDAMKEFDDAHDWDPLDDNCVSAKNYVLNKCRLVDGWNEPKYVPPLEPATRGCPQGTAWCDCVGECRVYESCVYECYHFPRGR